MPTSPLVSPDVIASPQLPLLLVVPLYLHQLRWNTRDPANVALINTEKVDEDISACMSLRGVYPLIKEEKKKEEVVIIVEEDEKKKKMKKVKKEKREEEEVKPTIMKRSRSPVSSTTTSRPEWIRIDKLPNYRELSWCTPVISEAIIKLVVVVNAGGAVREEKEIKLKGKTKRDGVTVWQVLCTVMNNIPRLGKNELYWRGIKNERGSIVFEIILGPAYTTDTTPQKKKVKSS